MMRENKFKHGIVLLSGGLDSATALAIAKNECDEVTALAFSYGQRHKIELSASEQIALRAGVDWTVVDIDLKQFGASALTDTTIDVPKSKTNESEIPPTYVPARNTIFLSYALALAEAKNADVIYIGANALDYSGYPDCRPEYIEQFQQLANLATKSAVEGAPVKIEAPLMNLTKAEIITMGTELGVDYSLTVSCYDPADDGSACSECDSCRLRIKGFADAGIDDPTLYYQTAKA